MGRGNSDIDTEKYRLRRFVERLADLGEVEVRDEPVPLTGLSAIIEATPKAVHSNRPGRNASSWLPRPPATAGAWLLRSA